MYICTQSCNKLSYFISGDISGDISNIDHFLLQTIWWTISAYRIDSRQKRRYWTISLPTRPIFKTGFVSVDLLLVMTYWMNTREHLISLGSNPSCSGVVLFGFDKLALGLTLYFGLSAEAHRLELELLVHTKCLVIRCETKHIFFNPNHVHLYCYKTYPDQQVLVSPLNSYIPKENSWSHYPSFQMYFSTHIH